VQYIYKSEPSRQSMELQHRPMAFSNSEQRLIKTSPIVTET
jgi:hypothetical protein